MDEEIMNALGEEIKRQIESVSQMKPGSEDKSRAVDDLVKLYKLRIEENKNEADFDENQSRRFMEDNHKDDELGLKKQQLCEQIKERYSRIGIAAAEIVLPLIFYASWMRKGFKFEEKGVYTSMTFKNLFNRFKPTK